jgi:predicted unusual protein kinase regulating ubiquinone biosynthesis (AarF/ABC1/UbiB family)
VARSLSFGFRRAAELARIAWRNRPAELADPARASDERARALAGDLERLGPTFVKLGQLLSTRPDLMPPAYIKALSHLQDEVTGFDVGALAGIVERELGDSIANLFAHFDEKPLAAASLAQVHRAQLKDGAEVVVKVQRPGIRERIDEDMKTLERMAVILDEHTIAGRRYEFSLMLDEFRASLLRELDYGIEAKNLDWLRASLREFDDIVVPRPFHGLSTAHVLTMDYIAGAKITALSTAQRTGLESQRLAEELFRAYLKQVLVDGTFHADPHPGNVLITNDRKIALIDLGMVSYLSPSWRDGLFRLLLSLAEGRTEDVVDLCLEFASTTASYDDAMFKLSVAQIVTRHHNASVSEANLGQLVIEITRAATASGMRPPSELLMLGKMMLNLDDVARTLAPQFLPSRAIQRHAPELMRQRMEQVTTAHVFEKALELLELFERSPNRVNRLLGDLARGRFRVQVDAIDEKVLVQGIQKLANRVTVGVIDASLIVGSAMMMRIETSHFHLFGYPGFAVVFFLAAVAGAVALMLDVLLKDESGRRRRKKARRLTRINSS